MGRLGRSEAGRESAVGADDPANGQVAATEPAHDQPAAPENLPTAARDCIRNCGRPTIQASGICNVCAAAEIAAERKARKAART